MSDSGARTWGDPWFTALGPLGCRWAGEPLNLGGGKQQMVLALLVLEPNTVVSVDRLVEWVWPDEAEPGSAATLQVYMSNLRRLLAPAADGLGRQLIVTRRPGYELQLADEQSDLLTFEALRRQGEQALDEARPDAAVAALRAALELWRGEPLAGLPTDSAATARLEMTRVAVMEQTAEAELAVGHHRQLLGELQSWVAEHELNERLRGHLMVALYRCGRQADALAVYREGRRLLLEELGIDPSRELRELERRILDQDQALDLPRTRAVPIVVAPSTELRSSVIAREAHLVLDGTSITLDRAVTSIGRLPDRDIVVEDTGVSRVHAEVRRVGTSFRLVDVGSANGTVVNGSRVVEHTLRDGDVIRLGGAELTFRLR
ncbi:MAG: BTAD domain-containing putative transcriptional regulator [Ilumatobacteraceae bacterium]